MAVTIYAFDVSPPEIRPGEAVTLTWDVEGESVVISPLSDRGMLTEEYYEVAPSGEMTVPTDPDRRGSVEFVIFVRSGDVVDSAQASAKIRCPTEWFFSDRPNPPPDCPRPAHPATIIAQRFERGWMMRDPRFEDQILILFYRRPDDPTGGSREYLEDTWEPGMPEEDPEIKPPAGYYEPVGAMGKAWREPYVRDRLGWATTEPVSFETEYQCDTRPKYSRCFVAGPDNEIFQLGPEGSWELWPQPTPVP